MCVYIFIYIQICLLISCSLTNTLPFCTLSHYPTSEARGVGWEAEGSGLHS